MKDMTKTISALKSDREEVNRLREKNESIYETKLQKTTLDDNDEDCDDFLCHMIG